jgi:acyl-CoA thioesterase-1
MQIEQLSSEKGRPGSGSWRNWVQVLLACTLLLLGACSRESAPGQSAQEPDNPEAAAPSDGTIVAMGDSLTAGLGVEPWQAYPARLEKKLMADGYRWQVINAGVSGETSSGALSRIQWVLSALDPDIVILETGANDGLRGIDPGILKDNLEQLVAILKAHQVHVILAGMRMLPNMGPEYVQAFERVYQQVASAHNVTLIPFFLEGVAGKTALNQPDGIHPTAQGYARIVGTIYPYVVQAVKQRTMGQGQSSGS